MYKNSRREWFSLHALHFERRQEAVVDAFFEPIDINRVAKVFVRICIVFAFGRSS